MANVVLNIKTEDGNLFKIGKDRLDTFSSLSQSTSSPERLDYGVLPNSGNINIVSDIELQRIIEDGTIPQNNVDVDILLNDSIAQKHISTDSTYDVSDKSFNISVSDNLQKLNNVNLYSENNEKIATVPFFHITSSSTSAFRNRYSNNSNKVTFEFTGDVSITKINMTQHSDYRATLPNGNNCIIIDSWTGTADRYVLNSNNINVPLNSDYIEVIYPSTSSLSVLLDKENFTYTYTIDKSATVKIHTYYGNITGTLDDSGFIDATNGIDLYVGRNKIISLYEIAERCLLPMYSKQEISNMFLGDTYVDFHGETGTDKRFVLSSIKRYLKSTLVSNFDITQKNSMGVLKNICNIAQINGFNNDFGNLVFKTGRPIFHNEEDAIFIPPSFVFDDLNYSIIKQNQYTDVVIPKYSHTFSEKTIFKSEMINALDDDFNYIGDLDENKLPYTTNLETIKSDGNTDLVQSISLSVDLKTIDDCFDLGNINDFKIVLSKSVSNMSFGYFSGGSSQVSLKTVKNGTSNLDSEYLSTFVDTDYGVNYSIDKDKIMNILVRIPIKREFTKLISGTPTALSYENIHRYTINIVANTVSILSPKNITESKDKTAILPLNPFIISNSTTQKGFRETKTYVPYSYSNGTYHYLKDSILHDYKNGASIASVRLACGDLYFRNGAIAKTWSYGEILCVGEIIYFLNDVYNDGSQRYWKITSRKIDYTGVPELILELIECRVVDVRTDM